MISNLLKIKIFTCGQIILTGIGLDKAFVIHGNLVLNTLLKVNRLIKSFVILESNDYQLA